MRYLSIGIMFFCAILMLSAGLNAQEAEAQTGPDWLKNVDPNDYLLLASDLNEPYFLDPSCATIPGCIYSDIRDQETAIGSRISKDNISILFCQEAIVRRPPGDKERSEFDINVYVFETPGLAESYRKELSKHGLYVSLPDNKSIKENVTPTYNGLNDPRLEGVGYSSSLGNWIRYKNIVAEISGVNDLEANYLYVPILSRLWLDKVTKIKPAYAQCQLEVELDTEETNESSIVQISVINEITEMPVQGADLKIVVTDQKSGISNTSQAKTDLNGQYMLNFSWQPADFGKTFLVEVDATLEECSDYSSLYIIAPPITGIIGDVLEAGLLTPPVTNGYVWISPPQIDDVSKLSPNTTPPIIKSFKWDERGRFNISNPPYTFLEPGNFRVWAWASGYIPTSVPVELKEEKVTEVHLRLATSLRRLDFHVLDNMGEPAENAEIILKLPGMKGNVSSKTDVQGLSWLQLQGTIYPCEPTNYSLEVNINASTVTASIRTSIPYCNNSTDFGATYIAPPLVWEEAKAEFPRMIRIDLP